MTELQMIAGDLAALVRASIDGEDPYGPGAKRPVVVDVGGREHRLLASVFIVADKVILYAEFNEND